MSVHRDIGPGYGGNDVLDRLEKFRTDAITLNQAWWSEANIDVRVEAGDPHVFRSLPGYSDDYGRSVISLNRVRRIPNMVSGYQRQNRNSTTVIPIENASQQTADQFTKIMMWINKNESVLETVSDAFHGALITGMNLLQVWVDYRDDPISGDIKVDRCEYNSFIIDPYFRKSDLSDCNGILKRSYLTREECASLLPGFKDEVMFSCGKKDRDGKFPYMPENLTNGNRNLLTYDEFYYRTYRERLLLVDRRNGDSKEWTGSEEDLLEYLSFFPEIEVVEQEIPTVNLSLVVQGNVIYDGRNTLGIDTYPFVPVLAYYRPESDDICNRIQGMVRNLRDAQWLYNRRKANENDLIESQINTGIIVKEDALVNFDDVFKKDTGQIMVLKHDAEITDIMFKDPPVIPQSTFQLSESMANELPQISGVNEELLGSATDDKAGILSQLRQGAALTTLRPLFDLLDRSQKLLGSIILRIVQRNFTAGKVMRIIDEEPTEEFYHKAFGKYDSAIEEGVNTTTQRQLELAQLLHVKEMGVPIPDESILQALTVQNKTELLEAVARDKQEQAQIQQMQMQSQLDLVSAQIEAMQAKAKADLGWALERTSRVPENRAFAIERLAEAEKDRQQAILNMAKTLTEIDDSKLAQIEKLLQLSGLLSQQSVPEKVDVATPSPLEQSMFKQISRDNQDQTKNESGVGQPANV